VFIVQVDIIKPDPFVTQPLQLLEISKRVAVPEDIPTTMGFPLPAPPPKKEHPKEMDELREEA